MLVTQCHSTQAIEEHACHRAGGVSPHLGVKPLVAGGSSVTRGTQMTHHRRPTNPYTKNSAGQPKPLMMKGAVTYAQTVPAVAPAGQAQVPQAGPTPLPRGTGGIRLNLSPQMLLQGAAQQAAGAGRPFKGVCTAQPLQQDPLTTATCSVALQQAEWRWFPSQLGRPLAAPALPE